MASHVKPTASTTMEIDSRMYIVLGPHSGSCLCGTVTDFADDKDAQGNGVNSRSLGYPFRTNFLTNGALLEALHCAIEGVSRIKI